MLSEDPPTASDPLRRLAGTALDRPPTELLSSSPLADRLVALFEVLLCSGFPTQILVGATLMIVGLQPFDGDGGLSFAYVSWLSALDATLLVTLVIAFLRLHGERPWDVLVGQRRVGRELYLGVLVIPLVLGLAFATLFTIRSVSPWMQNVPSNPLEGLISTPWNAILFTAIAVLAGGLREEIQRGFVLWRFEQYLGGPIVGLVLFSVMFGAGHLLQGWDAAIATGVLGAFWGALYLLRRSIVAAAVSHSAFNFIEILRYVMTG